MRSKIIENFSKYLTPEKQERASSKEREIKKVNLNEHVLFYKRQLSKLKDFIDENREKFNSSKFL